MSAKITFLGDWPDEPLQAVKTALAGQEALIPAWCGEVLFFYCPDESGGMECRANYEYRTAYIRTLSRFLNESPESRREFVRHELIHISTNVPFMFAEDVIRKVLPGDENKLLRKVLLSEMRDKHEGCVQDLSNALEPLFK